MQIITLSDWQGLERWESAWRELWTSDPRATFFQSPEWLGTWWPVFGSGELLGLGVWDGETLVGLGLFFVHPWEGRRQVTFVGNGVSDQQQCLLRPGYERAALQAMWEVLESREWDLCDLQDIPEGSPLLDWEGAEVSPQYPGRLVELGRGWAAFHAGLPHGLRRNLERYRKRLEAEGAIRLETTADVEGAMEWLFALHGSRWEEKEGSAGMFAGERLQRFHREAARRMRDRVRMNVLSVDGQVVTVNYIVKDGPTAVGYACGFDPAWRRCSPGTVLLGWSMEQAIQEGMTRFDFLRGDEEYKETWGATGYQTMRLRQWRK